MTLLEEKTFWTEYAHNVEHYIHYDEHEYQIIVGLLRLADSALVGKRVLEIGCGTGVWTKNLAALGAEVYPFDLSAEIVTVARATTHPTKISGFVADMHHIPFAEQTFDYVFGSMVVHHTTDHIAFGREVARVLKSGGRAVFHENSARNPLLMFARKILVGRFGIPKNSSPGEHPLQPAEIQQFGRAFNTSRVFYGRMFLFQLAVKYLLKRESGSVFDFARILDNWLYAKANKLRAMTYYQILCLEKD